MSRRSFSRLDRDTIDKIVLAYYEGKSQLAISKEFGIHHTTVAYHVKEYDKYHYDKTTVYAVIKSHHKRTCEHPSLKCFLCGMHLDNLRTEQRDTIFRLEQKLKQANERLEAAGLYVE